MSIDFYPEIGQVRGKDGVFRPLPGLATKSEYLDLFLPGIDTTLQFEAWWGQTISRYDSKYKHLEGWFSIMAKAWKTKKYTLKYYKPDVSSSSEMFPEDDLADKQPAQLCTDATSPVEDWADNDPMTWYVRANALSLADGTMNILAIEGLDDDFDLTGETAPVWTFSMALWKKEWDEGDYKYKSWATTQLDEYYKPYAGDVDPNTNKKRIMTWRPTFPGSLTADGSKLTSGVGGKPYLFVGAETAITKARAMDAYEGLWNDADAIWVLDMWQLRHFNLENSGVCEGCQSYDYSPTIAVAETGATRVLLTAANAANYQVGSNVSIGTARANNIRTILSKEDVDVGGTTYTALNLDGEVFGTATSQKVFTMPWNSGNTENLPGHKDGACHSLTAGQNPLRVQGVEMMSGAYDIGLDPLYNVTKFASSKGDYAVFECRDSEKLAGSITSDYEDTGISYAQIPKGWNYPKAFTETDKAVLFLAELGGSTSAYYKSGFSGAASAGVRCPWRYGHLGSGARAGLACEGGYAAPSNADWVGRPRLSGSGKKRGVWTA